MPKKTIDPVNQELIELESRIGLKKLGPMSNSTWFSDPRRLTFTLARYKFVSKMLVGKSRVGEIGCGDGFASRIVRQSVGSLLVSDVDPYFIEAFRRSQILGDPFEIEAVIHDILESPLPGPSFDAIYSLDVLEHIPAALEAGFLRNIVASLNQTGVAIIGMPSLESQTYASPDSAEGHVNCKSGSALASTLEEFFHNVFIFSMNDEVVHTGFAPMAHYLLAVCCFKKR